MTKLVKILASSLLAASLTSVASAATLLDTGSSVETQLGKSVAEDYFEFEFVGGSLTFTLKDAFPEDGVSNITLIGQSDSSWVTIFSDVTLTEGGPSYTVNDLLAGLYRLSLGSLKGDAGNARIDVFGVAEGVPGTDVSAVPLPGAALLFASGLFGAGAMRRRKRLAAVETPVAA